jgi:DNA-binding XRE family transcriptional regulator
MIIIIYKLIYKKGFKMFNYIDIPYAKKIMELLTHHRSSAKLADYLEVSRGSIVNWKDDDSKINDDNRLKIDVAYCEAFGFSAISADAVNDTYDELLKIDFSYFNVSEEALVQNISRSSAFGSLEIEETNISQKKFNKIVIDKELVKNLDQREFLSINNLATLNDKIINDALKGDISNVSCKDIKNWHFILVSGIRSDAGEYSTKYRIIPGSEELTLTDPRDVPEELERWTNRYASIKTLKDIAKAHAHFELIHPFGDGNGRIGRLLVSIHTIQAGFIPPLIDKNNKALYYVVLKHAQVEGEHSYLSYFIAQSILAMHRKFFRG